ncbi:MULTISPECIES: DUF1120 domain-containing protein [unclassified Pseudomonas]|uniref:DUF1120 domain-containing protein n=1 Tax=unclassified Pseudomonas TaxID=196821 RepID=UPI002AC8965C|nr:MULTISPECIES: DUF1120 domain-containing protein [unclassified Pseudomonas]MEB0044371.1 DUF1120 domain-containing protein [Pseudomonas sp. Dout3]MEB0094692.1 DUF1120 domain-containing protein [Pseudomonas sp. DC1.2]WPX59940.1 DUF1120 domain-containing protein [Pseudomonas sp. DC1.2]
MNTTFYALATTVLLGACASASAASTVDLTVKGVITPNACTPSLSGNGTVDYGKISAKDLNLTSTTVLPAATLQMTVLCDGSTLFAMKGTDNRAGSSISGDGATYGLGLINGTQKLGDYALLIDNAVADAAAVTVLESDDKVSWMPLDDGMLAGFGNNASGAWAPIPIQQLTSDVHVRGFIARADSLDLTDEQPIDGSATLEIVYL